MKKFYPKKDLSAEVSPVMLQLQRRHTVMEADNDGKKLKPISRSSSTSSMYKTPNVSIEGRSAAGVVSPDSASSSTASTVVITESELASSWLYNNKKALNSSSEALNTGESSAQQRSDKEMTSPILPRPKVKSSSYSSKRSKCATCCCYLSVILIVCLSAMGILSAVGGIVYMELFTTLNKTQNNPTEAAVIESEVSEHNSFQPMKKIGHPTVFGEHQKSPEVLKIENRKSEKGIVKFSSKSDLNSDGVELPDKKLDSQIGTELTNVPDDKNKVNDIPNLLDEKDSPSVEESTVTEIINSKSIEEDIAQIIYNISENFNPMKNFLRNKDGSSPYSKLFELYKGIHSSIESQASSTEPTDPEIIESSFESIDLSTSPPALFPNDSHMILGSEHEENENKKDPEPESDINSILTIAEEPDLSETDEMKENDVKYEFTTLADLQDELKIESNENISETKDTRIPMYFFKMPTELVDENDDTENILLNVPDSKNIGDDDNAENLEIADIPTGRFLPHIPDFFNENKNLNEHSNMTELNGGIDEDSDAEIDLNSPITGVAIPKPFNMFNRPSKDDQVPGSQADLENQDRQFSLAKALERLRMLDTRNLFPTARSASQNKNSAQKKIIGPKKQTDEEIASERSTYLQILREKLIDNE